MKDTILPSEKLLNKAFLTPPADTNCPAGTIAAA